jgi:hypothetical protein
VICLIANRLRTLGAPVALALTPAVLAAIFLFTSGGPVPDWMTPLSFLIVYAIAGIALATLKEDPQPERPVSANP